MDDVLNKLKKGKAVHICMFELNGKYLLEVDGEQIEKSHNPMVIINKLKTLN